MRLSKVQGQWVNQESGMLRLGALNGRVGLTMNKQTLVCRDDYLYWAKGYACDGPTFVFDYGRTRRAAQVHDMLHELLYEKGCHFTRKDADRAFCDILKEDEFLLPRTWWLGVRLFGWIPQLVNRLKKGTK